MNDVHRKSSTYRLHQFHWERESAALKRRDVRDRISNNRKVAPLFAAAALEACKEGSFELELLS
jgi:hypothetical protein